MSPCPSYTENHLIPQFKSGVIFIQIVWQIPTFLFNEGSYIFDCAVESFGPSVFQVLDSNGIVHDYDILPSTMDTCHLEYVDIIPNGVLEGCVAYEVPETGKLEFIYAPYQYEGLKPGRYLSFIVRP